jgi:hypothetical protein
MTDFCEVLEAGVCRGGTVYEVTMMLTKRM